jgi:hypothetical protein
VFWNSKAANPTADSAAERESHGTPAPHDNRTGRRVPVAVPAADGYNFGRPAEDRSTWETLPCERPGWKNPFRG